MANLSRRSFISGTAAVASTAALAGTVTSALADEAQESTAYTPSFLQAPAPIDAADIKETVDADIVIIGSALSGLCACRAAVENGAKNIVVIEKADTWQCRSNQFGTIGGKIQEDLGIKIDRNAAVGQLMKECGYRPNQRILNLWADNSGEAFDWFLAPMEGKYVVENESDPYDAEEGHLSVRKTHWPEPDNSHTEDDFYPIFSDCQITLPTMAPWVEAIYNICVEAGVTFKFSTWARQLVRENNEGPVTGVIAQDYDGHTYRATAKAVILAAGDYASNNDMRNYYVPWATRFASIFPNRDAAGDPTNTGDGQCMGMWIGAKMEDGPLAPMTHHLGGPLGMDAFLLTDVNGDRFVNEDVGGQPFQNQLSRLPKKTAWQVFDSEWPNQLQYMDCGHGNVSWYVDDDKVPGGSYGRNAYISQAMFDEAMSTDAGVQADTIEELAEKMGVPVEEFCATIERYNELAKKGVDEDFGKRADRMFAIENPPFYGYKLTDTVLLVCMGGLETTVDFEVLDTNDDVIPGLYAVGNAQGGRFLVDYPLPCPGISHGMAMTHGMLVGRILAAL